MNHTNQPWERRLRVLEEQHKAREENLLHQQTQANTQAAPPPPICAPLRPVIPGEE